MEQLRVEHPPREPPLCTQPPAVGGGRSRCGKLSLGADAQRDLNEQLVFGQLYCQPLVCNVLLVLLNLFYLFIFLN